MKGMLVEGLEMIVNRLEILTLPHFPVTLWLIHEGLFCWRSPINKSARSKMVRITLDSMKVIYKYGGGNFWTLSTSQV